MSIIEWGIVGIAVGVIAIVWLLMQITARNSQVAGTLASIDAEIFRLAQQQDPSYGLCSKCGTRATVRHVVPKDRTGGAADEPELFYCKACWWLSDSVELSDENKHYRDRQSAWDRIAASIGPGS